MKKTQHPVPVADLTDEVWTIDHIAAYLRMRRPAAYVRIAAADFPTPFTGNQRHRRWVAEQVKAYFATPVAQVSPAAAPSRSAAVLAIAKDPGKPTRRPRRVVAA